MEEVKKTWHDETALISKIENLNFPPDREWKDCTVTVTGTKNEQSFSIKISENSTVVKAEDFTLGRNETRVISVEINKQCSISITGQLSRPLQWSFEGAGGVVEVVCSYTKQLILNSETVSWHDETAGISCIERLFLDDAHNWKKCEIKIEGNKNKETGCMTTLIANGALVEPLPSWVELHGTESKVFTYEINQKVPLVVAGYITNHSYIPGGGAKVTLTGYYSQ